MNSPGRCTHDEGATCLFATNGYCQALSNTNFGDERCPFFKDMRKMTAGEIFYYNSKLWLRKGKAK